MQKDRSDQPPELTRIDRITDAGAVESNKVNTLV